MNEIFLSDFPRQRAGPGSLPLPFHQLRGRAYGRYLLLVFESLELIFIYVFHVEF